MTYDDISIVICDDEPKILEDIENEVNKILVNNSITANCISISQSDRLVKYLDENKADILLLDIDMPYINGLDIAKLINDKEYKTLIIFITNKEALVYESFQYHPFDFVRKSVYKDELEKVIIRALGEINKKKEYYIFKSANGITRILFSDILYFEADANYVKIITKNEQYIQRETLLVLEEKLSAKGFVRIHKGYLVNQEAVYMLKSDRLILVNNEELPIGRTNREEIKKELLRYLR